MKKLLSPWTHGLVDWAVVAFFAAAPLVFGFTGFGRTFCWIVAVVHAGLTGLTDYPWGVMRAMPFRAHAAAEVVTALLLAIAAVFFADAGVPAVRNLLALSALGLFAVWLATNYREPGDVLVGDERAVIEAWPPGAIDEQLTHA